jgi:hypothetical protein
VAAAAFEQVAALGLDDNPVTRRLATRDALVGAPPALLAAGAYDADEGDPRTAAGTGWSSPAAVSAVPR